MTIFPILLLVASLLLLHTTNAVVYNVKSDEDYSINSSGDSQSEEYLEYYLQNSSKYFSSFSQLNFKMGLHYLNTDLVIQNATNVTMIGEGEQFTTIRCASFVSIIIIDVTNFTLKNILIIVMQTIAIASTPSSHMILLPSVVLGAMHQSCYNTAWQWKLATLQ